MSWRVGLLSAVAVLVVACTGPLLDEDSALTIDNTDVVGEWTPTTAFSELLDDSRLSGERPAQPRIEFRSDGTVVFDSAVVAEALSQPLDPAFEFVRRSGTWRIEELSGGQEVYIDLDGAGTERLQPLGGIDGPLLLTSFVGDPDNGDVVQYRRSADAAD